MLRLAILIAALSGSAQAGGLIAARTLPAGSVIAAGDLIMGEAARGISTPSEAIGMQTRITIYEGRPIMAAQLQTPRLVARNQIVRLAYRQGPLMIEIEGRALGEGGAGQTIPVMNISSRMTISATINPDGSLTVIN